MPSHDASAAWRLTIYSLLAAYAPAFVNRLLYRFHDDFRKWYGIYPPEPRRG